MPEDRLERTRQAYDGLTLQFIREYDLEDARTNRAITNRTTCEMRGYHGPVHYNPTLDAKVCHECGLSRSWP